MTEKPWPSWLGFSLLMAHSLHLVVAHADGHFAFPVVDGNPVVPEAHEGEVIGTYLTCLVPTDFIDRGMNLLKQEYRAAIDVADTVIKDELKAGQEEEREALNQHRLAREVASASSDGEPASTRPRSPRAKKAPRDK